MFALKRWKLSPPIAQAAALALALFLLLPESLAAQSFGRNKVQYDRFDFHVMETDHFDIYFYPRAEGTIRDAARMADRWYARLSSLLDHEFEDQQPVVLYADHPDFQQTNVVEGALGESTGGVTEFLKNRVVMPLTASYAETDHVLGHELTHAFQVAMAQRQPGGMQSMTRLPLWFVEGLAEYLSLGRVGSHTAMRLRDGMLADELPTFKDLNRDPRYFPYRWGHSFWAYVGGAWSDRTVATLFRTAIRKDIERAIPEVLGISEDSLVQEWHAAIRDAYTPMMEGRTPPEEVGRRLIAQDQGGGRLNVGPSISPDGRFVVFLSERDLFSIDLFLADVRTGEVLSRLASAESDAHFDALAWTYSTGSWSPDGQKFAFVVFAGGRNELAIVDVESRSVERSIRLEDVGAIADPAWSPDGTQIAFSGMGAGISDLYLLDVETESVRRLTDDRHMAVQPAWSPDGRRLAFATDRGPNTDFERLSYGEPRIAFLDIASGDVAVLGLFDEGSQMNPQFSPDGESLYFIADADGFSDIYRAELVDGRLAAQGAGSGNGPAELSSSRMHRVTRLTTGVTGISPQSAAMTVASRSGDVVFSVFEAEKFAIHTLGPAAAAGEPVADTQPAVATTLPPLEGRTPGAVAGYLADPDRGLPTKADDFDVEEYRPSLKFDAIGPISFGVAAGGPFGTQVGGGTSVFFSDMLGNRFLGVAAQANGTLRDIGGQMMYQNRANRWNWGVGGGHTPIRFLSQSFPQQTGPNEITVQNVLERWRISEAGGMVAYPFSSTRRVEFGAGVTRVGFDFEVETLRLNGFGQLIAQDVERLPSPDAQSFGQVSAALVGDNANFGFTSPVRGSRWRLEVRPQLGDIRYTTLLGDYRRYHMRNPFTLAYRGLFIGRFGRDGSSLDFDNPLNFPLFLGFETLVRGYDYNSFEQQECSAAGQTGCLELDRLFGTRMGVASVELRVPLLGVEEFGLIRSPLFPVELALWADAGVAWTGDDSPELTFSRTSSERIPVTSTGVSTRIGLGYFIAEIYYAYPFQRPEKGWHFGFNMAPGW